MEFTAHNAAQALNNCFQWYLILYQIIMQPHGPKYQRLLSASIILLFLSCSPQAALADANDFHDDKPVKSSLLHESHQIEKEKILQKLEKIVEKEEKLEISDSEKEKNLDSGMEILGPGL